MGWGGVLDKLLGFLPNKRESLRNRKKQIEREMDELTKQGKNDATSTRNYSELARKLRDVNERLGNE